MELPFIRAQRAKKGEKSNCMIGNEDRAESKRQSKLVERKRREEMLLKVPGETDRDRDSSEREESTEEMKDKSAQDPDFVASHRNYCRVSDYNTTDITHIAMAAARYGVSDNAAAAIANAALLDFGVISNDNKANVIYAKKISRAKSTLYKELQDQADQTGKYIRCIFFDGRKDQTLTYQRTHGESRLHPAVTREEHITVISEPGGQYVCSPLHTAGGRQQHLGRPADRQLFDGMDEGARSGSDAAVHRRRFNEREHGSAPESSPRWKKCSAVHSTGSFADST